MIELINKLVLKLLVILVKLVVKLVIGWCLYVRNIKVVRGVKIIYLVFEVIFDMIL